ncbi:aldehyde dehydrogenase family protein [Pseudonocardia sp. TRM90224]|uniref:aldehyde dehydrogenase family protein n=1 Tax=Pseudonocardia sp. TRM90224 TaxID=2812678 RepID=UPI0035A81ED0
MTGTLVEVTNPLDGSVVGKVPYAEPAAVEAAVAAAAAAVAVGRELPAHARAAALDQISAQLAARAEEFAQLITAENGKPIVWARAEVGRAVSTFRWAAEEARRFSGELQRLDTDAAATGRVAMVRRFPRGAVLGISPFNFPLNLVAHKIAPAIAVGAPILLKPAPKTPLTALLLAELIAETELPAGLVTVLLVPDAEMDALVADERLPVVSFTGSERVGRRIAELVPHKHVTLELGGNAAVVVARDWADLEWAADRVATFGNYQAGQSCIGVQRVLVDEAIAHEFVELLVAKVQALDPAAVVGPVIDDAAAARIEEWIAEATAGGAEVLAGGTREGRMVAPTVLRDAPPDSRVVREEVFGPVLVVSTFPTIDEAFAAVNDSRFGLQAGVFTSDLRTAFAAHRDLEVGGVVIGDVPSYRADQMPYGGWKHSGVGREGLRSAMDDYTDTRVLVLTGIPL